MRAQSSCRKLNGQYHASRICSGDPNPINKCLPSLNLVLPGPLPQQTAHDSFSPFDLEKIIIIILNKNLIIVYNINFTISLIWIFFFLTQLFDMNLNNYVDMYF